jgi:hypothetical protein
MLPNNKFMLGVCKGNNYDFIVTLNICQMKMESVNCSVFYWFYFTTSRQKNTLSKTHELKYIICIQYLSNSLLDLSCPHARKEIKAIWTIQNDQNMWLITCDCIKNTHPSLPTYDCFSLFSCSPWDSKSRMIDSPIREFSHVLERYYHCQTAA